ncbi:guanine nucleotide exchange protein for ADP-robosylation factor [Tilletia horrida]|uniref:Guanine nucleotide exchange protein for ADP-robosylation factor n=1 Tax=Tilletia horrida TaxID=155126 RepID=A0AAN6GJP8_9BASI|nr:guanine nucleotide exchange protein for ADP-robosylation factor [Tilletia horrida]KAK0562177.1 guanine nucleotide exchange protein for ADP-robosylation factor [Tilletia horrida]
MSDAVDLSVSQVSAGPNDEQPEQMASANTTIDDEDHMSTIDLEADTPAASDIGGPQPSQITDATGNSFSAQHPNIQPPKPINTGRKVSQPQNGPPGNGTTAPQAVPGVSNPDSGPAATAAPAHPSQLDPTMRFWFPALFSFYDIIMASDDLEVRRLALASLFDLLKRHGSTFPPEFWDTICKEILFPIFSVLRRPSAAAAASAAGGGGGGQDPTVANGTSPTHKFAALPPVAGPSSGAASAGSGINVLQEEMSVWLSTTMIQALRNLVDLWTHFFEQLERLLPELLELLCACICQENDTLARIGTSCLQTLVERNVDKLTPKRWEQVVDALVRLFQTTTAHALFDPALRAVAPEPGTQPYPDEPSNIYLDTSATGPEAPSPFDSPYEYSYHYQQRFPNRAPMSSAERRRAFKQIIVKCVLQLLLIETTHELLHGPNPAPGSAGQTPRSAVPPTPAKPAGNTSDALSHVLPPQESPASAFYTLIPPAQLLRLTHVLEASYAFSRAFNADKELRLALWKVGFMKQLPNLLKQESSSAATLVRVLVRMHADPRQEHRALRKEVRKRLVPLGREVVKGYLPLDPETQARNIGAWTPVVADIFRGLCTFEDDELEHWDGRRRTAGAAAAAAESDSRRSSLRPKPGDRPQRRKSGHAFDFSVDDDDIGLSSPENGEATLEEDHQQSGEAATASGKPKAYGVFSTHARTFYPLAVELLSKDPLPAEVGESLRHYFWKVGLSVGFVDLAALRAEREHEAERARREEERREAIRARERELERHRAKLAEEARLRREQEERERERRRWEAQKLAQGQAQVERDIERQRIAQEREQIRKEKEKLQREAEEEVEAQAAAATKAREQVASAAASAKRSEQESVQTQEADAQTPKAGSARLPQPPSS